MDHSRLGSREDGGHAGQPPLGRLGTQRSWVRFATIALIVAALPGVSGCQRGGRFRPVPADSTSALAADSARVAAEAAVKRWDEGADEDAARLSAEVVRVAVRDMPIESWGARAHTLLDSLSIGAEVGEAPGAILVNFFSRSDPERGSWPWLFWPSERGPRQQRVEGRDLRFLQLTTLGAAGGVSNVAALFARRGATAGQPIAFVWKRGTGGGFTLAQTLGADSLGGAGNAEFAFADTTLELQSRTYRTPRGFTECATCPHVYTIHRFRWSGAGFERESSHEVPSPYAAYVRFIRALQANDREAGFAELTDGSLWDEARDLDWHQARGAWRVAPSTDEAASEMVFFRGDSEAYRVHFESRVGDWKITGFEATSRTVE